MGRAPLAAQPSDLRTGLSAQQERTRVAIVERHFSFAPLDEAAAAALAAALAEDGGTLAQGLGLRNNLYREKQTAGRRAAADGSASTREALPATWEGLRDSALDVPPLDLLRRMTARRGKLSAKLASALVEALVEAHATGLEDGGGLTLDGVLASNRLRKHRKMSMGGVKAVKAVLKRLSADGTFLPTAAWACAHDLQGGLKRNSQRRGRAAERLAVRRLRAAGVTGRTEAQLASAAARPGNYGSTPDFVVDAAPGVAGALRWLDVKHCFGQGDPARMAKQTGRYCADWGPGALLFTLGYTEAYAEALRAHAPDVWILDVEAAERLLSPEQPYPGAGLAVTQRP